MKIPGLEGVVDEFKSVMSEQMIPLLEEIRDGVNRMVELEEERQGVERTAD